MLLYTPWRIGEQILAGLDPNFTVNAWGGPTYLGAMACHYLDGILMAAAAASVLQLLLPRESSTDRAAVPDRRRTTRRAAGPVRRPDGSAGPGTNPSGY